MERKKEFSIFYRNDKHIAEERVASPPTDTHEKFENESEALEWIAINGLPYLDYFVVHLNT